jgi:hypothetical protein
MRKSQSGTMLYCDGLAAAEAEAAAKPAPAAATPRAAAAAPAPPPPRAAPDRAAPAGVSPLVSRLIVVANRLPVSASRDKDGAWRLQVRGREMERVGWGC